MAQDEVTRTTESVWEQGRLNAVRNVAGYDSFTDAHKQDFDHYLQALVYTVRDAQQVKDTKKLYAWAEEFQREGEAGRLYAQAIRRAADKVGRNS